MPKRKCKLPEDLRKKYACFRNRIPGNLVSVANKETLDIVARLETTKHKKHIGSVSISFKVTNFFVQPHSKGDEVHTAEGTLAFHCVKHHNISSSTDCTSNLKKEKTSLL
jgi:hypothetical protein